MYFMVVTDIFGIGIFILTTSDFIFFDMTLQIPKNKTKPQIYNIFLRKGKNATHTSLSLGPSNFYFYSYLESLIYGIEVKEGLYKSVKIG